MKVLITGGTGFIGRALTARLARDGHEVTIVTRSFRRAEESGPGEARISYLQGNPVERGPWQTGLESQDVIINLAGASIFSKWSAKQKKRIRGSRLNTTLNIVEGLPPNPGKPLTLISASAVGYYGFHGDEELDEHSLPGDDFLAGICREWEAEALKAAAKNVRVILTRFGIVLGEKEGALSLMARLFKLFVGGPLGSGKQWFSWIHLGDLTEAIAFLIDNPEISGPVNLCAPNPVRNKVLAETLGNALHRPSFFRAPAFMVRLVLGEFGTVILKGQRVIPRALIDHGFIFGYPELSEALREIQTKKR
jgi:hypothetical protein